MFLRIWLISSTTYTDNVRTALANSWLTVKINDVFIAKDLPICQMAVNLAANGSTVKTVVQQVLGDDANHKR